MIPPDPKLPPAGPNLAAKLRGRANKIRGDQAELLVAHHLRMLGYRCVMPIATGWRIKRVGGRVVGATPMAKVAGDFRAVDEGGRSVLVEVKRRAGNLRISDFQPHSRQSLNDHRAALGRSLVAWVNPTEGVAIFDWHHLANGTIRSMTWADAQDVCFNPKAPLRIVTPEKP